jgi:hypothetical protein
MQFEDVVRRFIDQLVEFLPNLAAGFVLTIVGIGAAWFVKRLLIQVFMMLRLHRLLLGFRWAKGLSRVDVRLSLYNLAGNLVGFIVFLVFLDAALNAMRLTIVSAMVERLVLIFPRLLVASAVFGIGWIISGWAAQSVRRVLQRERIPRATLVSGYARAMLVVFFGAMAAAQFDVSREIVMVGFAVVFITMGAIAILLAGVSGWRLSQKPARERAKAHTEP